MNSSSRIVQVPSFASFAARALTALAFGLVTSTARDARAWGHTGHALIGALGAALADSGSAFWGANAAGVATLANVPDDQWKVGPTAGAEGPTHWLHADAYTHTIAIELPASFDDYAATVSTYGEDSVVANGTAPWRAQQLFDLAVIALQDGDLGKALEMAGTMAHYVGDVSQPLHVTSDYDGPAGSHDGIHAFFESENIDDADPDALTAQVRAKAAALVAQKDVPATFDGTVVRGVFREVARAGAFVDEVFANDAKLGRGPAGAAAQLSLATDRLADGTACLAIVLGAIWRAGGRPDQSTKVGVGLPAWVPPDYTGARLSQRVGLSLE
jgi:hypothetical protein